MEMNQQNIPEEQYPQSGGCHYLEQWFSTFARPQPGKFYFYKTSTQSQQIYS